MMKQTNEIMNYFDYLLQENGGISTDSLNRTLNTVVNLFSKEAVIPTSEHISKKIGIAEWIVKNDLKQRYRKLSA